MNPSCLVIGYGSIGKRHAQLAKQLGHVVGVVTQRDASGFDTYPNIGTAIASHPFDAAVVSNRTSEHYETVMALAEAGFRGPVLVEKPVFDRVMPLGTLPFDLFVGYHFRCHPMLKEIHRRIKGRAIHAMHVYCGQHLSQWRPGRHYTECYSASKQQGGGVLRDLSHELDYINWLTGGWTRVAALGGKFSNLKIDSDDVFCLLLETRKCPAVTLQVNYLDRIIKREIVINGDGISIHGDLIRGALRVGDQTYRYDLHRDEMYTEQLRALTGGAGGRLATLAEGINVLELIEAAESAAGQGRWVTSSI